MRLNQPRVHYVPLVHSKTLSKREKELQTTCKGNWERLRKTTKGSRVACVGPVFQLRSPK